MEFGAKPKPGPEELTWLIISEGNQDEVKKLKMKLKAPDNKVVEDLLNVMNLIKQ